MSFINGTAFIAPLLKNACSYIYRVPRSLKVFESFEICNYELKALKVLEFCLRFLKVLEFCKFGYKIFSLEGQHPCPHKTCFTIHMLVQSPTEWASTAPLYWSRQNAERANQLRYSRTSYNRYRRLWLQRHGGPGYYVHQDFNQSINKFIEGNTPHKRKNNKQKLIFSGTQATEVIFPITK